MTEAEWLEGTDPQKMLKFLRGKASDRKLRLFAVACNRRVSKMAPEAKVAFQMCEDYAEGRATSDALLHAFEAIEYPADLYPASDFTDIGGVGFATRLAINAADVDYFWCAEDENREECLVRLGYLKDIFGPLPFRPIALNPSWLTPTVTGLAETIYQERAFDRMPILADALEDAGCGDKDILSHCRQVGEHVRGCWVVDMLTGRE